MAMWSVEVVDTHGDPFTVEYDDATRVCKVIVTALWTPHRPVRVVTSVPLAAIRGVLRTMADWPGLSDE